MGKDAGAGAGVKPGAHAPGRESQQWAMRTLTDWARQIDAVLRSGLRGSSLAPVLGAPESVRAAYARGFADDFGHRREVDPPLLAWVLDVPPWGEPAPRADARLWAALKTGADPLSLIPRGEGPVAPEAREIAIEVWTEIELASLQALWWHGRGNAAARERAVSLARWLMAELQPDNGTNRPWAVAAFAEMAAGGDVDAGLYADTLLHNCQVSLGKPDLLSTVILLDAAACIRALPGTNGPHSER
jgi:hypothetical protein